MPASLTYCCVCGDVCVRCCTLQRIFRDCGVVAIRSAIKPNAVAAHWEAMEASLDPYLASRRRVLETMLHVGSNSKHKGYEGYRSGLAA
eukprot:COSAG02_NODE_41990_length_389_cov_0.500000_1_plen_88_part_10